MTKIVRIPDPMKTSTYVMNVNMVEHQRSLLAVLGIDVWMPKADTSVRNYNRALYRDQVAPEFAIPPSSEGLSASIGSHEIRADQQQTAGVPSALSLVREQVRETPAETIEQPVVVSEAKQAIHVEAFELQVWCNEQCLICVDTTQLNTAEIKLWQSIQMAKAGQYFDLKWPFALAQLQDGRGAQVYVQGFLDAIRGEKKVLSLGCIQNCPYDDVVILASLTEMLEQPMLKRHLWMQMR